MGDAIRSLLKETSSHQRPRQLAAAVALGLLCGLLPKSSLIFWLTGLLCCALPIHLPLAALVCVLGSLASFPIAELAGRLGVASLTHVWLVDVWLTLDRLPWVPWLALNNSVVHGSLLIGVVLSLPVYGLSRLGFAELFPDSDGLAGAHCDPDFVHIIAANVAAESSQRHFKQAVEVLLDRPAAIAVKQPVAPGSQSDSKIDEETCTELESLLANCRSEEGQTLSTAQVAQRAAQVAEFVDDLLTSCLTDSRQCPTDTLPQSMPQSMTQAAIAGELACDENQCVSMPETRESHQHIISSQASENMPSMQFAPARLSHAENVEDMPSAGAHPMARRQHAQHIGPLGNQAGSAASVPHAAGSRRTMDDVAPEETLRYLLHHLKAIKDKV